MQNSMKAALVVRKGAWTDEEDALLRKCIGRHGEGKWHLVPMRAGLNRCRKSCRMRWLNYLKPNIKRGEFVEDEADMIIRLHKLLGNKWSLIAGRIPGRTANDVKNYWNACLGKKAKSTKEKSKEKSQEIIKVEVLKPRARTFKKASAWLCGKATFITCTALKLDNNSKNPEEKLTPLPPETEAGWWEGLSDNMDDLNPLPAPVCELLGQTARTVEEAGVKDNEWDDVLFDIDLWQLWDSTARSVAPLLQN